MKISRVTETERADFLALVNAEIRPDRAKTNAWDDFPLILGPENSENQWVCVDEEGQVAGGIACLIRHFKTTCGILPVAGIGSVVTHPDHRGKGLSTLLQNEMLTALRRKNVPLAVLWTDQPEIYAGRGFRPAGWELHAQLDGIKERRPWPADIQVRGFLAEDVSEVEDLYHAHPLGTRRENGDSLALYTMPGTRGLVACDAEGHILAAVFCGKGGDFPRYVTEWCGPGELALALMCEARDRDWVDQVLVPAGTEELVNLIVDRGGSWFGLASGYWNVLLPEVLIGRARELELTPPPDPEDPALWLGQVDEQGHPLVGPLTVAVWGFDSV